MITYKLIEIQEKGLSVSNPILEQPSQQFLLGWDVDVNIKYPQEGQLDLTIRASAVQEDNEDRRSFASIVVSHCFEVEGIAEQHPQQASLEDRHLLATLIGVSLGTIRGLMYARTVAILGKNVFMPIMNPLELLNNAFPLKSVEEG